MKRRKYEDSHPWLTFHVDLRHCSHTLWLLLGEIQSKCEHLAGVPLEGSIADELHFVTLSKGVHATVAIEGNSLSEEQVRQVVDEKLKLPPSSAYLQTEVENVISACNSIRSSYESGGDGTLSVDLIRDLNRKVLQGLELPEYVVPGEIPVVGIGVQTGYRGAPREDCEHLLGKLCSWLNGPEFCPKEDRIVFGVLRAILVHLYLAWIHPFGDGNGRTARLLELFVLLGAGAPTPAAHLLSNFYNKTRQKYFLELDKSSKSGGNPVPFIEYACRGLADELREQLASVRRSQWKIAWQHYVYERFRGHETAAGKRQRRLVFELTKLVKDWGNLDSSWVELASIRTLSGEIATSYGTKTDRTIARDVNELQTMGMVTRRRSMVRAKPEVILQFLPMRFDQPETPSNR